MDRGVSTLVIILICIGLLVLIFAIAPDTNGNGEKEFSMLYGGWQIGDEYYMSYGKAGYWCKNPNHYQMEGFRFYQVEINGFAHGVIVGE